MMERQRFNWKVAVVAAAAVFGPIVVIALSRWFMGELGQTYRQVFERVQQEVREERITVGASDEMGATYSLLDGWNLISFPFEPSEFKTAAELIGEVAVAGGYVTTVSGWEKDQWLTFSQRGGEQFGDDFAIEPFKAYFVRSHEEMEWEVGGKRVEPAERKLSVGWNGVGFPGGDLTARLVVDGLNQGNVERVNEVDRWQSGFWDPFVKRIVTADNIQEYGTNFAIEINRGYMIKAEEPVELKL